jgi:hypothetical protein
MARSEGWGCVRNVGATDSDPVTSTERLMTVVALDVCSRDGQIDGSRQGLPGR